MAPEPRTAVYKDSVVAYLALKSHFAISDNHPSDKSLESGEFMNEDEKKALRKKLFELRMQCIKDGEGGSGV